MGETVAKFSNRRLCLKPERGPRWCARWDWLFCAFHGRSWTNYTVGQTSRTINAAALSISGGTSRRRCCGHICVGEALHRVHCRRSRAAVTTSGMRRLGTALSLAIKGQGIIKYVRSCGQGIKINYCFIVCRSPNWHFPTKAAETSRKWSYTTSGAFPFHNMAPAPDSFRF